MTARMVAGGGSLVADQRDVTRRLLGERGEREDQYLPLVRRDDVDGERARCDRLDHDDARVRDVDRHDRVAGDVRRVGEGDAPTTLSRRVWAALGTWASRERAFVMLRG